MNRFHQRRQILPLNTFHPGNWIVAGCLVAGLPFATGCQQPNGQMGLPVNPMVGSTCVPSPPTGSVGANTGYAPSPYAQSSYGAQQTVGLPASDLMAQLGPAPAVNYAPAANFAAANDYAPAATYAAAADYAPTPAAALQQAAYVETSASAPSVSLAPQLRGMQVNDLTPAGQNPQLQAQAQAQAQFRAQIPATAAAWPAQAPALTRLPALPPVTMRPGSLSPLAGQQDSWNVVGSGVAAPSTAPVAREASAANAQSLPWRAPTTAR